MDSLITGVYSSFSLPYERGGLYSKAKDDNHPYITSPRLSDKLLTHITDNWKR